MRPMTAGSCHQRGALQHRSSQGGSRAARSLLALMLSLVSFAALACPPGQTICKLSEIGGCAALQAQLAAHQPAWPITLVIDQQCGPYAGTLTLPGRITLAGVGRDGAGELLFTGLPGNVPALAIAAGQGHVQIRDLLIRNIAPTKTGVGLLLDGNSMVTLNGVRIDFFGQGVSGTQSYSVLINQSNISGNGTNLRLGQDTNAWRVRDTVLSQAAGWSVIVRGPNNDVVFDGNRLESNQRGGFLVNGFGTVLSNNRLEFNGALGGWRGIEVTPSASQVRLLHNYFSTDIIVDSGADTQCAFNTNVVEPATCL
jgi:hypothetical protein